MTAQKRRRVRRIIKFILLSLLFFVLVFCAWAVCNGYLMYREALMKAAPSQMAVTLRTQENYTPLDSLPPTYLNAVVAVEDHRYYTHGAVDFISTGRAVWVNLTHMSFVEGGSTITQQLAKNLYFTQEKSLLRKVAEVFMAYRMESELSKDEILELYVNTIYFGDGYIGIHDASNGYYHRAPNALNAAQCTILAGIPNAPSVYSPSVNPDLTLERQGQVLEAMVEYGYLTQEEADTLSIAAEKLLAA